VHGKKYQKPVAIILAVIIIAIAGWYAYSAWVLKPKEDQANDAIFKAQQYFSQDSFKLALSGDGSSKGFKYIAENYSGTQTGNLAKFYAGICYLRTGDF